MTAIFDSYAVSALPVVVLSAIGLSLVLCLTLALSERFVAPARLRAKLYSLLSSGRIDEARSVCFRNRSALAAIVRTAIEWGGRTPVPTAGMLRTVLRSERLREVRRIEANFRALQEISELALPVALFFATLGAVSAFRPAGLDAAGATPEVMTAAIEYITLAAGLGLVVGLPARIVAAHVRGRIREGQFRLKQSEQDLIDLFLGGRTG